MKREAIRADYNDNLGWLDQYVKNALTGILVDARVEFQRRCPSIAPPKMPECRVKEFVRIVEKMARKNVVWPHDSLFEVDIGGRVEVVVNDLVAGRIVCATPSDVGCVATILAEWTERLSNARAEEIHNRGTGYRAYHLDARIEVFKGNRRLYFPVEIQIKTLLQDAWANFGHDEFYKTSDDLPEVSVTISRHLADVLAGLDMIGQAIREEKLRKRPATPSIGPEETLVTPRTLGYLAARELDAAMSDVELQKCVAQMKAFGYESVALADALLGDPRILTLIEVAKTTARVSGGPTPYEVLFLSPLAATEGLESVVIELRRMYGLTELTCAGCDGAISEADREYIVTQTDLDSVYYCSACRDVRLRKCGRCSRFTESELCKDCRATEESAEIL